MSETQLVVYPPQGRENLEEYISNYTDAELRIILSHPEKSEEFCSILLNFQSEPTDELQRLWGQMKYLIDCGRLKPLVQSLKSVRRKLLESLAETANHLEQYTKYEAILRLISSVGEIAGIVGGLRMRNSAFDYSNGAFRAASAFSILGTISTLTEFYLSRKGYEVIMKQLKEDQQLFTPIEQLCQQSKMLQEAMSIALPPDILQDVINDIVETAGAQFGGACLLAKLFRRVIEKGIEYLRNEKLLRNMIFLFSCPAILGLIQSRIYQQNPIIIDVSKMMLELQYSLSSFILWKSVSAFYPQDQELRSTPFLATSILSFGALLEALRTLRRSEKSPLASEMKQLHTVLERQLTALDRIIEHAESRKIVLCST